MENRPDNRSIQKEVRRRAANTLPANPPAKARPAQQQKLQVQAYAALASDGSSTSQTLHLPTHGNRAEEGKEGTDFSQMLRTILRQDRNELQRVAQALGVSENSIYRWMSGSTEPRIHHLKRLPDVLPTYREQLIRAINNTFHGVLALRSLTSLEIDEVPKDIYRRVIELISTIDEDDIRFWEVSQALFEHALYHLDSTRRGLAITYAHLLPPLEDGIHALREAMMWGQGPWPEKLENRAYLGSTSLAGTTAILQRMQTWDENATDDRLQVETDEQARSACAVPVIRGNRIAGVVMVFSVDATFFQQPMACQAVEEYTQLLGLALREQDFYPFSSLHLRPMPDLNWQRKELMHNYIQSIVAYARKHQASRQEAEFAIQQEIALEFERIGQEQARKQPGTEQNILQKYSDIF